MPEENGRWNIITKTKKFVRKNEWKGTMKKLSNEEFIAKARKIHGEKYDYSLTNYTGIFNQFVIICNKHGKFNQTAHNHLNGNGCYLCGLGKQVKDRTMSLLKFINLAKIKHKNKYSYSQVKYINSKVNVNIVCSKHGTFPQQPGRHLSGCGCPECGKEMISKKLNMGITNFINCSKKIHNEKYDYSKVHYTNTKLNIEIICPLHGPFFQTPEKHLMGRGCSKCIGRISKSEIEFLNLINIPDTKHTRQVSILKKKVDGYDPQTNTVYEFLGDYWHGNPETFDSNKYNKISHKTFGELYQETFNKFNKLKSNGYNIKYIWENDWKKWNKNNRNSNIPVKNYPI